MGDLSCKACGGTGQADPRDLYGSACSGCGGSGDDVLGIARKEERDRIVALLRKWATKSDWYGATYRMAADRIERGEP